MKELDYHFIGNCISGNRKYICLIRGNTISGMAHEKQVVDYSTGEVGTVNDNFVQLYVDKLDLIIEMTGENPTAVKVFTWIIKHMDRRNALVVSQTALAEAFGVSDRMIRYSIAYLKEKKALTVLKSGNTNIYAVNAQIAWKSDANGKRYALFDAAVYISEAEQDKPLFSTQLVGHAQSRERGQKQIKKKSA
ncbi:replication/maintenance protein RepL [Hymenobacter defluvii]|nr:replication/maintenance protein RepL [Hymenobacter defluvii]